jgi:hypothetical protein
MGTGGGDDEMVAIVNAVLASSVETPLVEAGWALLALGHLRLVEGPDRNHPLGVEISPTRVERREARARQRPLVNHYLEMKRRGVPVRLPGGVQAAPGAPWGAVAAAENRTGARGPQPDCEAAEAESGISQQKISKWRKRLGHSDADLRRTASPSLTGSTDSAPAARPVLSRNSSLLPKTTTEIDVIDYIVPPTCAGAVSIPARRR